MVAVGDLLVLFALFLVVVGYLACLLCKAWLWWYVAFGLGLVNEGFVLVVGVL